MLQSNQPYQRVDDGVGAGLVAGGILGGVAAGAAHKWGQQGIASASQGNMALAMMRGAKAESMFNEQTLGSKMDKIERQAGAIGNGLSGANKVHQATFGGGVKGKAAAYAGSILTGGVLGAGADALNN